MKFSICPIKLEYAQRSSGAIFKHDAIIVLATIISAFPGKRLVKSYSSTNQKFEGIKSSGSPLIIHQRTLPKENISPFSVTSSTRPVSYSGAIYILGPTAIVSGVSRSLPSLRKHVPKSVRYSVYSSPFFKNKILSGFISL